MKIKDKVLKKGSFSIKDGSTAWFWEDNWVGNVSFRDRYPSLYNIVRDPHAIVAKVMATRPLNISFRRTLLGTKLRDWHNLVAQITPVNLTDGSDTFRWDLTKSGLFTRSGLCICILSILNHLSGIRKPRRLKSL